MKLISCHIENFGKLSDCTIHFAEGANHICQENGWGKSTLAAFIRAMFYGLEGERKRNIDENEFKRYTPWQGGVFGGQLTFEIGGKQYTVTRNFAEQDGFELRDANTNLISYDYTEKLGEELFRVNRESFMRTVFIGQADCETAVTDDVNAKIGNLAENANDMNRFEATTARLKEMLNSLTPSRKTGSLSQRKGLIAELERKVTMGNGILDAYKVAQEKWQEESKKYNDLKQQIEAVQKEQAKATRLQDILVKKTQWENLKQEFQAVGQVFPAKVPDMESLQEAQTNYNLMEKAAERQASYELTEQETVQLQEQENARMAEDKGKATTVPPILIFGVVLAVLGILLAGITGGISLLLTVIGGVVIFIGIQRKNKNAKQKASENERLLLLYDMLKTKQQNYEKAEIEYKNYSKQVADFLIQHGYEMEGQVSLQLMKIRDDVQAYTEAYKKLKTFENGTDLSVFERETNDESLRTPVELNELMATLSENRENSYQLMRIHEADMESLQEQFEEWEEQKSRLEELKSIQEQESQKYKSIIKVQEYLTKAKESITNRYSRPILNSFCEYYELLTGKDAKDFAIDANIQITKHEQGKQREINAFSAGNRDLTGICLRFALVDAMYQGEKPMLILDDPFVNLDDEKIKAAKKLLEHVAEKYQIIYFTCSEVRN